MSWRIECIPRECDTRAVSAPTHPLIEQFLTKLSLQSMEESERLSTVAQAVSAIPWGEGRTIEEVLQTRSVGTCTGKHLVLQACLDALGMKWRPVVCTFRWSEQGLRLPDDCSAILAEGEWRHGHNFIQIDSGHGWIDLDVTWDRLLATHGFRCLPANWNGRESFVGLKTIAERWDGVSIQEKKKDLIDSLSPALRERRERFLRLFIGWIASLR